MKSHKQRIHARTVESAKNIIRRYGRIPTKVKLMKNAKKYHGMNLYEVTCHNKK